MPSLLFGTKRKREKKTLRFAADLYDRFQFFYFPPPFLLSLFDYYLCARLSSPARVPPCCFHLTAIRSVNWWMAISWKLISSRLLLLLHLRHWKSIHHSNKKINKTFFLFAYFFLHLFFHRLRDFLINGVSQTTDGSVVKTTGVNELDCGCIGGLNGVRRGLFFYGLYREMSHAASKWFSFFFIVIQQG